MNIILLTLRKFLFKSIAKNCEIQIYTLNFEVLPLHVIPAFHMKSKTILKINLIEEMLRLPIMH